MYITNKSNDNLSLFDESKGINKKNETTENKKLNYNESHSDKTVLVNVMNSSKFESKSISFVDLKENNKSNGTELENAPTFSLPNINFKNVDKNKLNEKLTKISELVVNIDGAENLKKLLGKVKPDYKLTKDDYSLLSNLNNEIKNKMNSSNLSQNDKLALETFSKSFEQLNDCKEKMEVAHSTYINTKKQTDSTVVKLTQALGNSLNKLKNNSIDPATLREMMKIREEVKVSVKDLNSIQDGSASPEKKEEIINKFLMAGISSELINKFLTNYKGALMAGLIEKTLETYKKESDKAGSEPTLEFSLYQAYMQKFISALENGASDNPQKLYEVMATYDNLVKKSNAINTNNSLSNEEKKNQLKSLVSEYTKDNPEQLATIMALIDKDSLSNFDALKAVDILGNAVGSLANSTKINSVVTEISGKSHDITHHLIAGASEKDLEIAKNATVESFNFIKADPVLNNLFSNFNSDLNKLFSDTNKYILAESLFNIKSIEFNLSLSSFENKLDNVTNDSSLEEDRKELDKLIEKANEMQYLMDLSFNFDDKEANITTLLENLRNIIVELDLGLRSIKNKTDSKIQIDTDFLKNVKENEKRYQKMDQAKEIMNKIFKLSKEVNIVNVSDSVKRGIFKNDLKSLALAIQELSIA